MAIIVSVRNKKNTQEWIFFFSCKQYFSHSNWIWTQAHSYSRLTAEQTLMYYCDKSMWHRCFWKSGPERINDLITLLSRSTFWFDFCDFWRKKQSICFITNWFFFFFCNNWNKFVGLWYIQKGRWRIKCTNKDKKKKTCTMTYF